MPYWGSSIDGQGLLNLRPPLPPSPAPPRIIESADMKHVHAKGLLYFLHQAIYCKGLWPKVKRTVIWFNTCFLALSHLLIKAREHRWILNISANSRRTPTPTHPTPSKWWGMAVEWEAAQQPALLRLILSHRGSAAELLSWVLLCLRCHWQCYQLSRNCCWIFIPSNEVRNSKCTAGSSDHRSGLQGLGLGTEGVIV